MEPHIFLRATLRSYGVDAQFVGDRVVLPVTALNRLVTWIHRYRAVVRQTRDRLILNPSVASYEVLRELHEDAVRQLPVSDEMCRAAEEADDARNQAAISAEISALLRHVTPPSAGGATPEDPVGD